MEKWIIEDRAPANLPHKAEFIFNFSIPFCS